MVLVTVVLWWWWWYCDGYGGTIMVMVVLWWWWWYCECDGGTVMVMGMVVLWIWWWYYDGNVDGGTTVMVMVVLLVVGPSMKGWLFTANEVCLVYDLRCFNISRAVCVCTDNTSLVVPGVLAFHLYSEANTHGACRHFVRNHVILRTFWVRFPVLLS